MRLFIFLLVFIYASPSYAKCTGPLNGQIEIKVLECEPFHYKKEGKIRPLIRSAYEDYKTKALPELEYFEERFIGALVTAERVYEQPFFPLGQTYTYIERFMYPSRDSDPCLNFPEEKRVTKYYKSDCCDTVPGRGLCALDWNMLYDAPPQK